MNILLVFAHPEPQSFNGAMLRTAIATLEAAGHQVRVSDLYAQPFEPVSDRRNFTTVQNAAYFKQQREEVYATAHQGFALEVEAELQKLAWCDVMIWQFPLWWFSVPAVLKGWVDRVFAMGRVYGAGQIYENGVFRGKRALLSLTTGSGSPAEAYQPGGLQGDLLGILRPIHGTGPARCIWPRPAVDGGAHHRARCVGGPPTNPGQGGSSGSRHLLEEPYLSGNQALVTE
jgi:putative NADPH-quinone reductase